jgi:hypothetical protein
MIDRRPAGRERVGRHSFVCAAVVAVRRAARVVCLAAALAVGIGGCGIGASREIVTFPPESVGPAATVSPAVLQTRGIIAAVLGSVQIQLGDAKNPFRPAESPRVAAAPRAVYQAILPADPEGGQIVVYEFRDAGTAVDAGNELAGYLGTGAGRIQFPTDARHTIRQVGSTLIFYSWAPSTSPDPGSPKVADALATLGIGFSPPR